MEFFPYQQMAPTPYNVYENHGNRFQPAAREMVPFPYQGPHRWVDPYGRGAMHQVPRTETKPRLSKGEVEILEAEFQKNNKPSSSLKKGFAEQMRVDIARINNWFQNRRAKKKQELKALEQEANSKAEEEKAAAAAPASNAEDMHRTEQPDNLPSCGAPVKDESPSPLPDTEMASAQAPSQQSHPGSVLEFQDDAQSAFMPQETSSVHYPSDNLFNISPAHDASYFSDLLASGASSDQIAATAPLPMACSVGESNSHPVDFTFPVPMFPDNGDGLSSLSNGSEVKEEPQQLYSEMQTIRQTIETGNEDAAPLHLHQPTPLVRQPLRLKSPSAIDLAGRRKRPGLALSGLHGSSNGPATGIDFGRRADPGSPMRRVASATGFGPQGIRRLPSSQRFQERRQEALLQAARSPSMASPFNSMAPPTPDTPVLAGPLVSRETTVSSASPENDGSYLMYQANLASQHTALDQSLRTPPATPHGFGDVFSNTIGAALGFGTPEEVIPTPSMDTFPLGGHQYCLPQYVTDGYMSQPSTPGLPPQMSLAAGYYPAMTGGHNTEYNWSDRSMVSKSSPNMNQMRQIQFNNFTPQDFGGDK